MRGSFFERLRQPSRGSLMKAKAPAFLLADLRGTRSHNRPHTSADNPFSESHFKTLTYQLRFPKRFGCIEDLRTFCRGFFDWYNQDHHHPGIGLMTLDQVHYGQIDAVHAARQATLDQALRDNLGRFEKNPPVPPAKPTATWINCRRRNQLPECISSPSRYSVRSVPVLRPGYVTRIDSLHRHAAIRRMSRLHCDPLRHAMRNPSMTTGSILNQRVCTTATRLPCRQPPEPRTNKTDLKFHTRLYQSL